MNRKNTRKCMILLFTIASLCAMAVPGAQAGAEEGQNNPNRIVLEGNSDAPPIRIEIAPRVVPPAPGRVIIEVGPQKGITYYIYDGAALLVDQKEIVRFPMKDSVSFAQRNYDAYDIGLSDLAVSTANPAPHRSPARYVMEGRNRKFHFSFDLEPGVHTIKIAPDRSLFTPGQGYRGRTNTIGEASHLNTSTGYYYNPVLLNDAWGPLIYDRFVLQFKVLVKAGMAHHYQIFSDINQQTDGFFPKRGWIDPVNPYGARGMDADQFELNQLSIDSDLVIHLSR